MLVLHKLLYFCEIHSFNVNEQCATIYVCVMSLKRVCARKSNAPVGPMQDVQETFVFHEILLKQVNCVKFSYTVKFTVKSVFDLKKDTLYRDS